MERIWLSLVSKEFVYGNLKTQYGSMAASQFVTPDVDDTFNDTSNGEALGRALDFVESQKIADAKVGQKTSGETSEDYYDHAASDKKMKKVTIPMRVVSKVLYLMCGESYCNSYFATCTGDWCFTFC